MERVDVRFRQGIRGGRPPTRHSGRRSVPLRLRPQLIHGDLNPDNILVASDAPPALIDMAPYWRPAGFALAVLAYWLGPAVGNSTVLTGFEAVPAFDQLLVRAALRSVLVWHEFAQIGRPLGDAEAEFGAAVAITTEWIGRRFDP
jgi:hypothetical protein